MTPEEKSDIVALINETLKPFLAVLLGNRVVPPTAEPDPVTPEEKVHIEKVLAPLMLGEIEPYPAESDERNARSVETLRRRKGYWVWAPAHELRYHNLKQQLQCLNIEVVREYARKNGLQLQAKPAQAAVKAQPQQSQAKAG